MTSRRLLASSILGSFILLVLHSELPGLCQTSVTNDDFENPTLLSGVSVSDTASTAQATKQPGEPNHAGQVGIASVWWSWTAPVTDTVTIDTLGSAFDTLLAVYTGSVLSDLSLVASNDDVGPGVVASKVSFSAQAGVVYRFAVDGYRQDRGDVALNLHLGPPLLNITAQPQGGTFLLGSEINLAVSVVGNGQLAYQWRKDAELIAGETNATLQISDAAASDAGVYSVTVSDSISQLTSSNAVVLVGPVIITAQPQNITEAIGYSTKLSVSALGASPVYYQWHKDGIALPDATNSVLSFTSVQETNAGAYSVLVSNELGSVISSSALVKVIPPYTFTIFAGKVGTSGTNDGFGQAARFLYPHGVALDTTGNLYVVEIGNEAVRRITPSGEVSTLLRLRPAQTSWRPFDGPWGITVDRSNNVYIADTGVHAILKLTPDGTLTTLAGMPGSPGSQDGTNSTARFRYPSSLVTDSQGNVYVADWENNMIRKISPEGVVTTVAGTGSIGRADGWRTKATFFYPSGIGLDNSGNLFVADEGNNLVRKITGGTVSTLARGFSGPHGGATDKLGNVYIADMNRGLIRRVDPTGIVTTLAGNSQVYTAREGTGPGAGFNSLRSVAVDVVGNLYVADLASGVICKGVPFAVTVFPQSQSVRVGESVSLSIAAAGENFSYQWQFGGTPISGATNANLALGPVTATNAGVYSVIVSNSVGNWATFTATLRVLAPMVLQPPVLADNGSALLQFQNSEGGVPSDLSKLSLEWRNLLTLETNSNWQSIKSGFFLTNGAVGIWDPDGYSQGSRFYRVLER